MRVDSPGRLSADIGTSYTTAALVDDDGAPHPLPLTDHGPAMLSAVHVSSAARLEAGEQALYRAATAPGGLIAAPKRWITAGHTEFQLGGGTVPAHAVIAALLRAVVARARLRSGREPTGLTVAHPESWTPGQIQILRDAAAGAGLPPWSLRLVSEPRAAAHYLLRNTEIAPGTRIGIVDFGAATLDVTVLVAADDGTFAVAATDTDTNLGGNNIDAAIRRWVDARLTQREPSLLALLGDRGTTPAGLAVERVIRDGKEELSQSLSVNLAIQVGEHQHLLTLTRDEFDTLVAPEIAGAGERARATLERAGIGRPSDLHALYLTGGSSRIPLFRRIFADIGPVAIPDNPQTAVVCGALVDPGPAPVAAPTPVAEPVGLTRLPGLAGPVPPPVVTAVPAPRFAPPPARRGRIIFAALVGAAVVLAAIVAAVAAVLPRGPGREAPVSAPQTSAGLRLAVTATVRTGQVPDAIAVDPGAHTAYLETPGGLLVTALPANSVRATLADVNEDGADTAPNGVAVDPTTHLAYVASEHADGRGTLAVIDNSAPAVAAVIPVGRQPTAVAVDSARHTAYVSNSGDGTVSVVDTRTRTVTDTVEAGSTPRDVAVDPVSGAAYVLDADSGTVSVLAAGDRARPMDVGVGATSMVVDPSTHVVYLATAAADGGNAIKVVDPDSGQVTATIPIAGPAAGMAVDPGARRLYATNQVDGTVTVVDTAAATVTASIAVGEMPGAVAVDPTTHLVYVGTAAGHGSISVIGPR